MTNEDKLREIFPKTIFVQHKESDKIMALVFSDEWLNAEYKEPTKNDSEVELIPKEQTIDRVLAYFNHIDKGNDDEWAKGYEAGEEDAIAVIESMNPVTPVRPKLEQEPRWIPVSERLPEDSGEYFVTVIDEDVETYKHTGIAWYAHPKDYDVEEGDWRELMIDEKVIAWMPLPKPYEPQESEG